ncbi:MAG: hypothetical protein RR824_04730, partial [Clostridia bacterium]
QGQSPCQVQGETLLAEGRTKATRVSEQPEGLCRERQTNPARMKKRVKGKALVRCRVKPCSPKAVRPNQN